MLRLPSRKASLPTATRPAKLSKGGVVRECHSGYFTRITVDSKVELSPHPPLLLSVNALLSFPFSVSRRPSGLSSRLPDASERSSKRSEDQCRDLPAASTTSCSPEPASPPVPCLTHKLEKRLYESFGFPEPQSVDHLNLQARFDGVVGKDPLCSLLGLTVGLPVLSGFLRDPIPMAVGRPRSTRVSLYSLHFCTLQVSSDVLIAFRNAIQENWSSVHVLTSRNPVCLSDIGSLLPLRSTKPVQPLSS